MKTPKGIMVHCIPANGDVRSFEVVPGPAGVVHLTVIDRDADDDQSLVTGALDHDSAVALAGALLRSVGWTEALKRMARCVEACGNGDEEVDAEFNELADQLWELIDEPTDDPPTVN